MDTVDMRKVLAELAKLSAEVILPHFFHPGLEVKSKADASPVTIADLEAERVLREAIAKRFPDHDIIGEELEDTDSGSDYRWILDPIDGTRAFASGCPLFGTLIALEHKRVPLWGAIHLPALNRLYIGNGHQCWCNDIPVRLRAARPLRQCTLLNTDPANPVVDGQSAEGWNQLVASTAMWRSWGDCFGYSLLASGLADIMCDPVLNYWDLAAVLPVITGAGAQVSDWHGGEARLGSSLVAAHPKNHRQILRILQG